MKKRKRKSWIKKTRSSKSAAPTASTEETNTRMVSEKRKKGKKRRRNRAAPPPPRGPSINQAESANHFASQVCLISRAPLPPLTTKVNCNLKENSAPPRPFSAYLFLAISSSFPLFLERGKKWGGRVSGGVLVRALVRVCKRARGCMHACGILVRLATCQFAVNRPFTTLPWPRLPCHNSHDPASPAPYSSTYHSQSQAKERTGEQKKARNNRKNTQFTRI